VKNELRNRIISEIALDEEQERSNPMAGGSHMKKTAKAFEELGFPEGMTYGHRASLREECSRFLRFAYLVDFLAMQALSNIYVFSVKDLITRLRELDTQVDIKEIMAQDMDESK
jgi:dynein heavy chain